MRDSLDVQAEEIIQTLKYNGEFSNNRHLVILGNNASGKTRFSKIVLNQVVNDELESVYYIGPYNRTLSIIDGQGTTVNFYSFEPLAIMKDRLTAKNGKDLFRNVYNGIDGPAIAATELQEHLSSYKDIIEGFLHITLIQDDDSDIDSSEIMIKEEPEDRSLSTLSSSEFAILRILMEVKYAEQKQCNFILIDEFDSYLDIVTMQRFLDYIVTTFPTLKFIFVIHNPEALINITDVDVLLIQDSWNNDVRGSRMVMRFDVNEVESISELESKINRYSRFPKKNHDIENYLRICISRYLTNNQVASEDRKQISEIDPNTLSVRERVLYEYVIRLLKL